MSESNGVIRIGRKGIKKFAFGDGPVFEVDVVVAFQRWVVIDDSFRPVPANPEEGRPIPVAEIPTYHEAGRSFVAELSGYNPEDITTAEALDFLARLREQYDELATFFRPKLRDEQDSPATSGAALHFSEEGS